MKNNQSKIPYTVSKFPKQPAPYMHNMSQKQHIKTIISLWKIKNPKFNFKIFFLIKILQIFLILSFSNFPKNPIVAVFWIFIFWIWFWAVIILLIDQYLSLCAPGQNISWCNYVYSNCTITVHSQKSKIPWWSSWMNRPDQIHFTELVWDLSPNFISSGPFSGKPVESVVRSVV